MKKVTLLLLAIAAVTLQSFKGEKTEWKELKDFHAVMSKTFHPSEEGNLKPLREHAEELHAKAKAWAAAAVPEGYNKELTAKILSQLVAKTEKIKVSVKEGAGDDQLKLMIADAHETFHEIVEKCRKPEDGHKHEHGHDGHNH